MNRIETKPDRNTDCGHARLQHTHVGGVVCIDCKRVWTLVEFIAWAASMLAALSEIEHMSGPTTAGRARAVARAARTGA